MNSVGVEIVAHRGASADAPENTLAAIQLAWQQDADAAEIDVQLTADGQIVAIHDDTTLRTGGVDWRVTERSLAELKSLDVGWWKSPSFAGERIPTLAEVLDIVPLGKRLFIEVKCGLDLLPELHDVLHAARTLREQTVLISLDFDTIVAVKRAFPERTALWVTEQCLVGKGDAPSPHAEWQLNPPTAHLIDCALQAGLDGLDINDLLQRPDGDIELIRCHHLQSCVWTVNSAERATWLRDEGIASVTTDRPAGLRAEIHADPNR